MCIVKEELEIAYCLATNQAYPHKTKNMIRTIHKSTYEADDNIVWPLMDVFSSFLLHVPHQSILYYFTTLIARTTNLYVMTKLSLWIEHNKPIIPCKLAQSPSLFVSEIIFSSREFEPLYSLFALHQLFVPCTTSPLWHNHYQICWGSSAI